LRHLYDLFGPLAVIARPSGVPSEVNPQSHGHLFGASLSVVESGAPDISTVASWRANLFLISSSPSSIFQLLVIFVVNRLRAVASSSSLAKRLTGTLAGDQSRKSGIRQLIVGRFDPV
jgi:hypothetical protein